MAAAARVALPPPRRRASTLPLASTAALRTTVPWAERASTGYFGGTLWISRFSAPLEERMIALFSPGSGVPDGAAAAAFFFLSAGLSAGLFAHGLLAARAVGGGSAGTR